MHYRRSFDLFMTNVRVVKKAGRSVAGGQNPSPYGISIGYIPYKAYPLHKVWHGILVLLSKITDTGASKDEQGSQPWGKL